MPQVSKGDPFESLKHSACIINTLPPELLAEIFYLGVKMQRENVGDVELFGVFNAYQTIDLLVDHENENKTEGRETDGEDDGDVFDMTNIQLDDNDSEWEDEDSRKPRPSPTPFERRVSHVCRLWRETAINAPDLWTHISLRVWGGHKMHPRTRSQVYIDRSKAAPLHLNITITGSPHVDTLELSPRSPGNQLGVDKVSSLIVPKADQWAFLEIKTDTWIDTRAMLETLAKIPAAPLLSTLIIICDEPGSITDAFQHPELKTPFYLPFHGNAPNLRHVILNSVHIDWDGAAPMFQGLRSLELGYHAPDVRPSWASFSSYLENASQLATLRLDRSGPWLPPPPPFLSTQSADAVGDNPSSGDQDSDGNPVKWPILPLEIPSVQTLLIGNTDAANVLVSRLHFPNLDSLSLHLYSNNSSDFVKKCCRPHPGVESRRSLFQTIETLHLGALCHVDDTALEGMISALVGLKILRLECIDRMDESSGPDALWSALCKNAKSVLKAVKHKQSGQLPAGSDSQVISTPAASLSIAFPSSTEADSASAAAATSAQSLGSLRAQVLLPNLESLVTYSVPGDELRRFVGRRIKIGAPLKRLSIHCQDDVKDRDALWFCRHLDEFVLYAESESEVEDEDEDSSE